MRDVSRTRQRRYVDPLDLRDAESPPVRTISPVLLVVGPILAIGWLAAFAVVVGLAGGAVLSLAVLVTGPSAFAGLLLASSEPAGSPWRPAGHALIVSSAAATLLILATV